MKPVLVAFVAVAVIGAAACGGTKAAAPLRLDQRVPNEADAPGSQADPVDTRQTAVSFSEFIEKMGQNFINPTDQDKRTFMGLGLVGAIHDTRFFPKTPGGPHSPALPHLFSLVIQFPSSAAAKKAVDLAHADRERPCPKSCATSVSEFDVGGIDGAQGVRRYASAAAVEAAGLSKDHPYDSYAIFFSDGDFAYEIDLSGPPGTTSAAKAEAIVKSLYDRVKGAPVQS